MDDAATDLRDELAQAFRDADTFPRGWIAPGPVRPIDYRHADVALEVLKARAPIA